MKASSSIDTSNHLAHGSTMTNKKILLHIGSDKSGSSAIQRYLFENSEQLKEHSLSYPNIGISSFHHVKIANDLGFNGALKNRADLQIYREEIDSQYGDLILSSEHFYYCKKISPILRLRSLLDGIDVKIVVVLRNQIDYCMSSYKEAIKWGESCSFQDYLYKINFYSSYIDVISAWSKQFSDVEMKIIPFDKHKKDIVAPFLEAIGINIIENNQNVKRVNDNPAEIVLFYQRKFNQQYRDNLGTALCHKHFVHLMSFISSQTFRDPVYTSPLFETKFSEELLRQWISGNRKLSDGVGHILNEAICMSLNKKLSTFREFTEDIEIPEIFMEATSGFLRSVSNEAG